ncbi:GDP-L-fucose synthase [Prochlorococcus marinus str. MIT 1342]|uniref:NAD-dependent epimerase/dehydratase family protein n=1 Tax=Prochlorococcus TaxID=1218 RepID=UPI0007B3D151|nr:NAD(P)-dependent oxidoreductase [Prochlorococcus marinus]KZR79933.1 GDP-L-fucose synthase [Prochlorococcus marinus str. MIT 1342]
MLESFYKGKKVLVCGASGFVGSNLTKKLNELGAVVTGTFYENKPQYMNDHINYIRCDLSLFKDCMQATHNQDYVFMAAANSSGAAIIENHPLTHLHPNIIMNANILKASCNNYIDKFCFLSSNVVYPQCNKAVEESDCNNQFFDKYYIVAWMKRFTEIMCEMYSSKISSPMKSVVIRPANLYGPYDKFCYPKSKVIPSLIRKAIERQVPLIVWGNGLDVKDFLYIDDFIEGLLLSFLFSDEYDVFNISSGQSVTINQILEIIINVSDYKEAIIEYDMNKPSMIPFRLISSRKVKNLTGWSPKVSIEEGISRTIKWYNLHH